MPNWVFNTVNISGAVERVAFMENHLGTPYRGDDTGPMNFYQVIAPSDKEWESYNSYVPDDTGVPSWYDWNCKHWGTKWNACNQREATFTKHDNGQATLDLYFETAWGPPSGIMDKLYHMCVASDLTLDWYWEEEQGFGEEWEMQPNGEFKLTKIWGIPNSHADHKDQEKECVCNWEDDPAEWYEDCPGYKVRDETKEEIDGKIQS